ncbi:hypothetical protein ACUR5C_08000 [Aliikangiella sp. IMCC44653]
MNIINPPTLNITQQSSVNRNVAAVKPVKADLVKETTQPTSVSDTISRSIASPISQQDFIKSRQLQSNLVYERPKSKPITRLNDRPTTNTDDLQVQVNRLNSSPSQTGFNAKQDSFTLAGQENSNISRNANFDRSATITLNARLPSSIQSYQATAAILQRQEVSQLVGIDILA